MDIYCPRCAEPMDLDELHSLAEYGSVGYGGTIPTTPGAIVEPGSSFVTAKKAFLRHGCEALGVKQCEVDEASPLASAVRALSDVLGDDVDGLASELEGFAAAWRDV